MTDFYTTCGVASIFRPLSVSCNVERGIKRFERHICLPTWLTTTCTNERFKITLFDDLRRKRFLFYFCCCCCFRKHVFETTSSVFKKPISKTKRNISQKDYRIETIAHTFFEIYFLKKRKKNQNLKLIALNIRLMLQFKWNWESESSHFVLFTSICKIIQILRPFFFLFLSKWPFNKKLS